MAGARASATFAAMRPNGEGKPHRSEACALPRSWLPFDFDAIRDRDTYTDLRLWFRKYRGFGYETASRPEERPRARMIIAASRDMDRDECMRVGAVIARDIMDEYGDAIKLDPSVFRSEQPIYTPLQGAPTFILDGDPLDVNVVLAAAPEVETETHAKERPDPSADPIVARLRALGMIKRQRPDQTFDIRCPFEAQHSMQGGITETVYFPPHTGGYGRGHFKCLHAHCRARPDADFIAAIGAATGGKSSTQSDSEWTVALDIFRDFIAAPFSPNDVPEPVALFARAFSNATGFDVSGAIVAAVGAAAAVIDDRYRLGVRHSAGWFESARLWVALIGGPAAGKTPTTRAAFDPIKRLHLERWTRWHAENGDRKPGEGEPEPSLYTSDCTLEALSDVLRVNPRGVLMLTEEFSSWIGSIDAYRNGQGSRDRGEMLQLYDGGPHQIHRVKRGSFLVPNWGASVIAAGTPAGLRQQVKQLPDDRIDPPIPSCIMRRPEPLAATSIREALEAWGADCGTCSIRRTPRKLCSGLD